MSAPTGPEPPDAAVRDYIRANRATYTRASIERTLHEAGHGEEAIAAAWAAVEGEEAGAAATQLGTVATLPGISAPAGEGAAQSWRSQGTVRLAMRTVAFWATLLGFLVGYAGLVALLATETINVGSNAAAFVGLLVVVIPLAALGIGIALGVPERTRPIGLGLLAALLVMVGLLGLLATLAFIAVVIIFGICLVYLARGVTP